MEWRHQRLLADSRQHGRCRRLPQQTHTGHARRADFRRALPRHRPCRRRLRRTAVGQRGHHRAVGVLAAICRPRYPCRALRGHEGIYRLCGQPLFRRCHGVARTGEAMGRPGRLVRTGRRQERQDTALRGLLHLRPRHLAADGLDARKGCRCQALSAANGRAQAVLRRHIYRQANGHDQILGFLP